MKRTTIFASTLLFALAGAACGGGESGEPAAEEPAAQTPAEEPAGEMTSADWFQVDDANQTVTIDVTAGLTPQMNYWNFNGMFGGAGSITVPAGYTVTINLQNNDPAMAHSLGIQAWQDTWGGSITPAPAFEGAITANPTDLAGATQPGESASITFTADTAGEFAMICYIPGHAQVGMYVRFTVSSDGSSGVTM